MNKRYTRIIVIGLPVILAGGITAGAVYTQMSKEKQNTAQQNATVEMDNTELRFTAGVAEVLEKIDQDCILNADVLAKADYDTEESEYSNLAIANVKNYVNVRSTPDTNGEVVGKMYDDSVAQIVSVIGEGEEEWFQVVSGSVEGYIKSEYFIYGDAAAEIIDDYVTKYAVVKADRLNIREEPDVTAKRIGYMDNGEKGKLLELDDEWAKVLYTEGNEGYVARQYVAIEEQYVYAKSIEEEEQERQAQQLLAQRAQEPEEITPENTAIQPTAIQPTAIQPTAIQPTEIQATAVQTTEIQPTAVPLTASPAGYTNASELRSEIVDYAMQYLGNRYISGGRSLESGTDCSGFTCYTYAAFGYSLSRTPQGQWGSNGRNVTVEEAQPGDIVCYASGGGKCTHVGIYLGNGQMIHSANSRRGVVINDIYYDNTFVGIKNVID